MDNRPPWQQPQVLLRDKAPGSTGPKTLVPGFGGGSIPPSFASSSRSPGSVNWVADPHRYPTLQSMLFPVSNTESQLVLSSPSTFRNFLGFRNNSAAANLFIEWDAPASASSWLRITPNQMILFDVAVPQNDIWAFADAAGGSLSLVFSTILLASPPI